MTDLIAETALGGTTPRVTQAGPVTLTERFDIALASLALRKGASTPQPFGLTLAAPGEITTDGTIGSLWMAPGQWMIEAPLQDLAARLSAEIPGCSVTEQTDGWVIIDIDGPAPAIEALRERLVNLPPQALAPGRATRTLMHHMSVFVIRRTDGRLSIMGMRSMAGSLWHTLEQAAGRL